MVPSWCKYVQLKTYLMHLIIYLQFYAIHVAAKPVLFSNKTGIISVLFSSPHEIENDNTERCL